MKKLRCLLIITSLVLCQTIYSQDSTGKELKGSIGLSFSSLGENDVYPFEQLVGSPSYSGKGFFTLGLTYAKPLTKALELETALEYSRHKILVRPNLPPHIDIAPYSTQLHLLSLPLVLRVNIWKYFFINGGIMLNMDVSSSTMIDSQSGIGALAGLGLRYGFKSGISVFVNPYMKAHALLPFAPDTYHHHLMESGIRAGVGFSF